nr:helix-turn-helix transcriptional regulator [uncultured Anaerobutyricum sp.]
MNISEKIKQLRKNKKMSQKELAQKTGLSIGSIQGYEQGRYNPKLETVLKIADALEISPSVFYDDLTQEERKSILEAKAKKADKDNFNNVIEILANINDVFYWYAEDEDLYFFGTNEKVFALKPKSIQAIQKAIEGLITPIVEQLKIIEPLYELLVRRFGNIKNFIEDLKEDGTLLGEFCKEMSVSLCMDVDDVGQRVLIYLQIYCEEKRMSVKVITTQGEELIINPEV